MKIKHEVVISGMAGMFPESSNIDELKENLLKKINMVTTDERRWNKDDMDVPLPTGKLKEADAFDDMFFGIPIKHSVVLDQHVKLSLESTISALCDAGINPADLAGTDTGVIACSCLSEPEYDKSRQFHSKSGALITGINRAMQANRISFHLNTRGTSYAIDSSWSGCFHGIQYAYKKIANGTMKIAIVTSCSLLYTPETSYHYKRLGLLNDDGCTKSFSNDAAGYARSEACVTFILQRKEGALRSYGSVMGVSDSFQGARNECFPAVSSRQFLPVVKNLYDAEKIDPRSVAYVEAAGCASKVIDSEELNTIADVMLPGREGPLLIGSVKSNLGHCEASSDAVSLVKCLIAADSGIIPPNLNYSSPNNSVPALVSGELKVVTEPTPLDGYLIGINSISASGSMTHLIIKRNSKKKAIEPQVGKLPPDGLPRLFYMSGRIKESTEETLKMVENMPIDSEFIALSNNVFKKGIKNHLHRGFSVITNDPKQNTREINEFFTGEKPQQIWFVFTGMGSQWNCMGKEWLRLPIFAKSIEKCHKVLHPEGIDIYDILTNDDPKIFDDVLNSFLGIAAIQIGLVDVLYELGIYPDGIIGHSVGELGCGYADGCLTAEQMMMSALGRGRASQSKEIPEGLMAAIGKGYNEIKDCLPEGIDVACHNSKHNCTISGPTEKIKECVVDLQKKHIFARLVNSSNIAYHSRYIQAAGPLLLESMKQFIKEPKLRSKKWICTSVPEAQWDTDLAKYCSAEYLTNNLLNSVLFEEASSHIPPNATVIEIAPHGLLQPILKQIFPLAWHVPLTRRGDQQSLPYFLKALGRLYIRGHTFDIEKLYPPVDYPVSRGTRSLGSLLNWDHSHIFRPTYYLLRDYIKNNKKTANSLTFDLEKGLFDLKDYNLQGVQAIPLGAYLECGIEELRRRKKGNDFHLVEFKNIKMSKSINIIDKYELSSFFQAGSGNWELCDGGDLVFNADLNVLDNFIFPEVPSTEEQNGIGNKLYEKLSNLGLNLGPAFQLLKRFRVSSKEVSATILWDGKFTNFLETVLLVPVLAHKETSLLYLVNRISSIIIDLNKFHTGEKKEINVYFNKISKLLYCEGLQINSPTASPFYKGLRKEFMLQEPRFLPYDSSNVNDFHGFIKLVLDIIYSNLFSGEISNKDLFLFLIGEETSIYDSLQDFYQNFIGLNVFVKILPDDKLLTDQELTQHNSSNVLVAGACPSTPKAIELVKNSRQGYLLIRDNPVPQGFEEIISKKINNNQYALCKCRENDIGDCLFISKSSYTWNSDLEYYFNTSGDKPVYLTGYATKLADMLHIIEKTSLLTKSQNLRYIFHDLKNENLKPSIFKDQIVKGLRINILSHNKWGTMVLNVSNVTPLPKQVVWSSNFKFSQIVSENAEIKAIGLNNSDSANGNTQIGIIEYSGLNQRENICGIGSIEKSSLRLKPDGILKWKKPSKWSHDEISSVILPYCMAYYVIKLTMEIRKKEGLKYKTILVHCGSTPLSQAIITVALSEGLEVFTTYQEDKDKHLITKLFPKIPHENIVSCKTVYFSSYFLKRTNGAGVNIIVSPLPQKHMIVANSKLVSQDGIIYQTTIEKNFDDSFMGMGVFMKAVSIYGLSPSSILLLSNNEKESLRDLIKSALNSGEIKPLPFKVITSNIDNVTAKELLMDQSFADNRIILSPNGKSVKQSSLSLCEDGAHYLIIVPDESQGHLWINILEWLISRIASNIHIIIDWSKQTDFIHETFHNIKENNQSVNIYIKPKELIGSSEKVQHFINSIKQTAKLDGIFISSQEKSHKFKAICEAAKDTHIVYFTSKCEEENAENCLTVVDRDNLLDADILTSYKDALVHLTNTFVILSDPSHLTSSIVVDDSWKIYNQHLPWTLEEVLHLSQSPREFGWHQVRTQTLRLQVNRGLTPILIIPPIIKGQINQLIKNLFNPAFEAIIPSSCDSADELVHGLFKEALHIKKKELTLVCSDWSVSIGIQLGKSLESVGKKVNMIFLHPILDWDTPKVYQTLHQKVTEELKHTSIAVNKKVYIERGLEIIKKRLEFMKAFSRVMEDKKLEGYVVLVKNRSCSTSLLSALSEHCKNPIIVHSLEDKSFLEMLNNKKTAEVINSMAIINYKDAATTLPKHFGSDRVYYNHRVEIHQRIVNDYIRSPKK